MLLNLAIVASQEVTVLLAETLVRYIDEKSPEAKSTSLLTDLVLCPGEVFS